MTSNKQVVPVVAVWMVTYNHERFIAQAIEAVLMQKTTFPIRLIIGEDCSTDNTRQICLDYQQKYPDIITVRCAEKNNLVKNALGVYDACFHSGAKYVALCEGDDYWTDPLKLQKQVDFLESNPKYVLSCHDARVIDPEGKELHASRLPENERKDLTAEELKSGAHVLSLTMCFRNVIKEFPPEIYRMRNGDTMLTLMLGEFGDCKFQHEITPACYRWHSGGIWSLKSEITQWRAQANTYRHFSIYFRRKKDQKFSMYYLDLYVKKQLDIYTWELNNDESKNAQKTLRSTLYTVMRMKGLPSFIYVRKRFLSILKKGRS